MRAGGRSKGDQLGLGEECSADLGMVRVCVRACVRACVRVRVHVLNKRGATWMC